VGTGKLPQLAFPMLLPAEDAELTARDGRAPPAGNHSLPPDAPMNSRLHLMAAVLLSLPFVAAQSPWAMADPYAVAAFHGSTAHGSPSPDARPTRYSVSVTDYAWFDSQRGRAVPARVYCPSGSSERFPAIVFSTGLGRSRDDCAYLGRHWASCGYVAVHVQHKGSDNDARQGSLRPRKELQREFYDPQNIRNRPLDAIFVIDQLERLLRDGSPVGDRLDLDRIGVAGHDFGAQTAMALAGQVLPGQLAFAEPRVRAVVAMSAPVPLGQVPLDVAYGDVSRPCLHITGTADNSLVATTRASQRRLPFDHTAGADQYLLTFCGADHLMYTGNGARDAAFQRLIAECSTAFWDAYLKDDAPARAWLAEEGINTHLGAAGWVEKKLFGGNERTRTANR
jgi:dienelactone hydrolase